MPTGPCRDEFHEAPGHRPRRASRRDRPAAASGGGAVLMICIGRALFADVRALHLRSYDGMLMMLRCRRTNESAALRLAAYKYVADCSSRH